jgi:hypothetical protein
MGKTSKVNQIKSANKTTNKTNPAIILLVVIFMVLDAA